MNSPLRVRVFGDAATAPHVQQVLALSKALSVKSFAADRPLAGALAFRSADVAHGVMASAMPKVFARAKKVGCLTVNHWIGTDVQQTLAAPALQRLLRKAMPYIDLHVCVAPWLVEELARLNVRAELLPIVATDLKVEHLSFPTEHAVLAYAAAGREEFYGVSDLVTLASAFPRLSFYLCGGGELPADAPENFRNIGKVSRARMLDLYRRSSIVVRLARHDGLAKMVLEALARGRHVVWNHPLDGVLQAKDVEEAAAHLKSLLAAPPSINESGMALVARDYLPGFACARAEALYRKALDAAPGA